MNYKTWIIKFFVFISISIGVILILLSYLKFEIFNHSNRMPNIRKVNAEYRYNLVKEFIDNKFQDKKYYDIIIGDSQFYGFKQHEQDTFPSLINKQLPDINIINLSIVDGTEQDIIEVLLLLKQRKVKINTIIYNFNLSHFSIIPPKQKLHKNNINPFSSIYALGLIKSYWIAYLKNNTLGIEKSQMYLKRKYKPDRYNIINKNNVILIHLLSLMSDIANETLIVMSPHHINSLHYSGYNIDEMKYHLQFYKSIINNFDIKVLDLSYDFKQEDFLDILHLSKLGHEKIMRIIMNNTYNNN